MSTLDRKIQKITVPTIAVDQLQQIDTDDQNNPLYSSNRKNQQAGFLYPMVQINKYLFSENEVTMFNLDLTGVIPRVSISIVTADGTFISKSYPKDGDPVSVFIRSRVDTFNPIRCDFEIENVNSVPSKDNEGEIHMFNIEGSLRVPRLYAEECRSFSEKTSYETLIELANELGLGFASNELETSDEMTWICPYDTYKKFMLDVAKASYKNDDSFFKVWIDHYYVLNFVNVNSQFSDEFELEAALDVLNQQKDSFEGHDIEPFDTRILLSNHPNLRGEGNYLGGYTLINNCGEIVQKNGYRRFVQFYDRELTSEPKDKYQSYFIEPLNTEGTDSKILLRGRTKEPEIFAQQNKSKFVGIQTSNMHENYMHALINNHQNEQEINKMSLQVKLNRCNFNLYRGQRVPVLILNIGGNVRQKMTQDPDVEQKDNSLSMDKFLSGYYYISGMRIYWDDSDMQFSQELTLSRREWPIPHQELENLAQG
jgi:hypothetical protein